MHHPAQVQELEGAHRAWVNEIVKREWNGPAIVSQGVLMDSSKLPGYVVVEDNRPQAFLLYDFRDGDCEICVLYSDAQNKGYAWRLIRQVMQLARERGCGRVWLITTNDNTHAIRYYQKRGFSLRAVHINAMEEARKFKPQIARIGVDGIPILHEFEFEWLL